MVSAINSWWGKLNFEKKFVFLLITYFSLQVITRTFVSGALEFDEAEQVLFSQSFSLGYGSQPPLYEWLQGTVFFIFGLNVFSLALFKNALFVLSYFFIYKSAHLILKDNLRAALSSVSLLLTYTYGWQSMRKLTHSVLAVALAAITVYLFLQLLSERKTKHYLLLGLIAGCGILAKYNYFIFFAAFFLAAMSLKTFRPALKDKRTVFIFLIFCLIILPHFIWFFQNIEQATLRLGEIQMDVDETKNPFDFALCLLALFTQLYFIFLIFFPQGFRRKIFLTNRDNQFKSLLERFLVISVIAAGLLVVFFKIIDFEDRWLQPILFIFPTYYFLLLKNRKISSRRIKNFAGSIFVVAFTILIMILVCALFPDIFGYKRISYPVKELFCQIKDDTGFDKGLILSQDTSLAADAKLNFKHSWVITQRLNFKPPEQYDKILLVWDAKWAPLVPERLQEILPLYGIDLSQANQKVKLRKALYKHSKKEYYKIGTVFIDRNKP